MQKQLEGAQVLMSNFVGVPISMGNSSDIVSNTRASAEYKCLSNKTEQSI